MQAGGGVLGASAEDRLEKATIIVARRKRQADGLMPRHIHGQIMREVTVIQVASEVIIDADSEYIVVYGYVAAGIEARGWRRTEVAGTCELHVQVFGFDGPAPGQHRFHSSSDSPSPSRSCLRKPGRVDSVDGRLDVRDGYARGCIDQDRIGRGPTEAAANCSQPIFFRANDGARRERWNLIGVPARVDPGEIPVRTKDPRAELKVVTGGFAEESPADSVAMRRRTGTERSGVDLVAAAPSSATGKTDIRAGPTRWRSRRRWRITDRRARGGRGLREPNANRQTCVQAKRKVLHLSHVPR